MCGIQGLGFIIFSLGLGGLELVGWSLGFKRVLDLLFGFGV